MKKIIYYLLQYSWLTLGLFVLSIGIVLLIRANLGPAPWDVFHTGITNYISLTLGQVMILAGGIIVLLSWVLGVKPYTGTVLNMTLIGFFVDYIMNQGWFIVPHLMFYCIIYMIFGIILCGAGSGIYISANLGAGPRDSLMLALCKITGQRVGVVRTILEVSVVIAGYLLGGLFGPGTIMFSLFIGWVIEFSLNLIRKLTSYSVFINVQNMLLRRAHCHKSC
ncbi:MAG: YitT family protein [Clostridiales bacterium]|nr:YitT family protein [Clostridiales bacterium]MCF8021853.1 YitT family protein [Clostridiales bacterium]